MGRKDRFQLNPLDEDALFRFHIVTRVLNLESLGELRSHAVSALAKQTHIDLKGEEKRIGERSIYRWLKEHKEHGIVGLRNHQRHLITTSVVITPDQLAFFKKQKEEDPKASIPELIKRAKLGGHIPAGKTIDRTSLWRALRRMSISTRRGRTHKRIQGKRFAYAHRMDMVLCDGKHFRVGVSRAKRVVFSYLDDATRKILAIVVGPSESTQLFLRGLHLAIQSTGLMQRLYLDRGPGFKSKDSARVAASMDIGLILGRKAYPQGHGKIERYNQTLWNDLLRRFDGNPDIAPDFASLECRINHYVREMYNKSPHESLDGKTPHSRFAEDPKALNFPENDARLSNHFVLYDRRVVSNDCVVQVKGEKLEVPQGYARDQIQIIRHVLNGKVFMVHEQRIIELQPVDLLANAKRHHTSLEEKEEPIKTQVLTAAEMTFNKDFPPLVDAEGNCLSEGDK